ncbi:MAG: hypothetical protein KAS32_15490 [Candidatus Peribacteraceae bacterium]|nr:hypothetical protein [Candidatus Peribacteraceae bacterium]
MHDGQLYGFYRAKITEVDIPDYKDYGAARVFVPDVMTDLDPNYDESTMGLIAFPANNSIGGRNDQEDGSFNWGQSLPHRKGDWVWVFFENGAYHKPFYWNAINIQNSKLPPESRVNFTGGELEEAHTVYTVIKTTKGRSVIVADSSDVERIEITGKKRTSSPSSNAGGSDQDGNYHTIDGNQTVILFDERDGKEKILIRSHNGDFIHFDIDERELHQYFEGDIKVKTDSDYHLKVGGDFHLDVSGDIYRKAGGDIHEGASGNYNMQSGGDMNINAGGNIAENAGGNKSLLAGGQIDTHGTVRNDQMGTAGPAGTASPPSTQDPEGERDT